MNSKTKSATITVFVRMTVVVLLLAVAGLSTAAKNSVYYSPTQSVHYLASASKIKVARAPVQTNPCSLHTVARVILPQPVIRTAHEKQTGAPPVQSVSVTVALQFRSPPR